MACWLGSAGWFFFSARCGLALEASQGSPGLESEGRSLTSPLDGTACWLEHLASPLRGFSWRLGVAMHDGYTSRGFKWQVPIFLRPRLRRSLPLHSIGHRPQLWEKRLYRRGEINSTTHCGKWIGRKELMVTSNDSYVAHLVSPDPLTSREFKSSFMPPNSN